MVNSMLYDANEEIVYIPVFLSKSIGNIIPHWMNISWNICLNYKPPQTVAIHNINEFCIIKIKSTIVFCSFQSF